MNKQEFQQTIKNIKYKKDCVYMSSFEVFLARQENQNEVKPIETLVLMHRFGYEVEK